jgi:hypothetical protein
MQFRLRTLLIVLALAPPLLAGAWFGWRRYEEQRRQQRMFDELIELITTTIEPQSSILR